MVRKTIPPRRKQILTKSGRLRRRERRRLIAEANPKPGEVVLLGVTRRRQKGKRKRNSFSAEFVVKTQWAADTDVRKLLAEVRLDLGRHYQSQLLQGKRPCRGSLPDLKEQTLARDPGRPDRFGVKTGEFADRWLLLKIRGGPLAASTRIKPWGGDGRRFWINRMLKAGVDFQSVDGKAAEVISDAVESWVKRAVPASGAGVGTPDRINPRGGELRNIKKP